MKSKNILLIITALVVLLGLSAWSISWTPKMIFSYKAPDPEAGAEIYLEKCQGCHGDTGLGDGPSSSGLTVEVSAIGTAEVANQSSPEEWYQIIYEGRMEKFMPPFSGSLIVQDVWDVLSYVYSLSTTPEQLEEGEAVYQETCAECHSSIIEESPDFHNPEILAVLAGTDIIQKAVTGNGNDEHKFIVEGDLQKQHAVAGYVRSLGLEMIGSEEQNDSQEETEEATPIRGNVIGTVVNGSGGEVPEGLEVALLVHTEEASEIFTIVEPGGSFLFEDIELTAGSTLFAIVEYLDVSYFSDFTEVKPEDTGIEISITIYETTIDTSSLVIDWAHIFFSFPEPDGVFIVHEYGISNHGDETVASPVLTDPSLQFVLPEGASELDFRDGAIGQPFVMTAEGFGDPRPIVPGEAVYKITYGYLLPYDDNLVWEQPVNIPISLAYILLEGETFSLDSSMFEPGGTEVVYEILWEIYSGGMFSIGDEIQVEITGDNPFTPTGTAVTSAKDRTTITIVLGAVGLVMIGAGVWWWMRPSKSVDDGYFDDDSPETIMDEIIALDASYEAGKIDEAEYNEERAALKARLKDTLD